MEDNVPIVAAILLASSDSAMNAGVWRMSHAVEKAELLCKIALMHRHMHPDELQSALDRLIGVEAPG